MNFFTLSAILLVLIVGVESCGSTGNGGTSMMRCNPSSVTLGKAGTGADLDVKSEEPAQSDGEWKWTLKCESATNAQVKFRINDIDAAGFAASPISIILTCKNEDNKWVQDGKTEEVEKVNCQQQ